MSEERTIYIWTTGTTCQRSPRPPPKPTWPEETAQLAVSNALNFDYTLWSILGDCSVYNNGSIPNGTMTTCRRRDLLTETRLSERMIGQMGTNPVPVIGHPRGDSGRPMQQQQPSSS